MEKKIPFMNHVSTILTGLAVAAVLGYFLNLRKGDVGGFVWGLLFTPAAMCGVNVIRLRRRMRKQNVLEEGGQA